MTYSSHKFDSVLAEAASDIANAGFTEEVFGTVEDSVGWNGLVIVSFNTLLNIDSDIQYAFVCEHGDNTEYLVWINEDSQGFVTLVYHDPVGSGVTEDEFNKARDEFNESDEHEFDWAEGY